MDQKMANPTEREREKAVAICSSASKSNIKALITMVSNTKNTTVKFIQLPYNDLDSFRLSSEGLDGVILCHSINNRRFAITDVMDALYDKFLPHVKQVFGKDNVCVIAHDFPWPMGPRADDHARTKGSYMDGFRRKQFTTFECSKLAIISGQLETQIDMDEEDLEQFQEFINQCWTHPEPNNYVKLTDVLFYTIGGGMFAYVISRFLPAEGASPPSQSSAPSRGIAGFVLRLVRCPFKIMLSIVKLIPSWAISNNASQSLWALFKRDVLVKTIEMPRSSLGIFGLVPWISLMPFRLVFYSSKFVTTLVMRCSWDLSKYCLVTAGAYVMIPVTAKLCSMAVDRNPTQGRDRIVSDGENRNNWSVAPWRKLPFLFWRHVFDLITQIVFNKSNNG
ncbi:uncharacterized protein LOC121410726 isoform X2 [Lytechinus variegatus]|nr:uncharacterized protein LOC121410726 isoform X2 [Lytechinus variegatus]